MRVKHPANPPFKILHLKTKPFGAFPMERWFDFALYISLASLIGMLVIPVIYNAVGM